MSGLFVIFCFVTVFFCGGCVTGNSQVRDKSSFTPAAFSLPAGDKQNAEANTFDFGGLLAGDTAEHSFVVRNSGSRVLKISSTVASCGCTVSSIRTNTLAPGEQTFLDVRFNSKGYSGAVTQHVYVNTDDVDNPVQKFIIKASVIPAVRKK